MTAVAVTGEIRTATGRKDSRDWAAFSPVYRAGAAGEVITTRGKEFPVRVVAGQFTALLEPGVVVIENPDGKQYTVTVPEDGGDLWEIIATAAAFPPDTAQDALASAVTTYLDENPVAEVSAEGITNASASGRAVLKGTPTQALVALGGSTVGGQVFTADDAADARSYLGAVGRGEIFANIRDYGALSGDNPANESANDAAFAAALGAASVVWVPEGIFRVGQTVPGASNKRLMGADKYKSIIKGASGMIDIPVVSGPITDSTETASTVILERFAIEHLTIQYPGANRTEYPVLFMNPRYCVLNDVQVARYTGSKAFDDLTYNVVVFKRASGSGTFQCRITGNKLWHTSFRMDVQTDASIFDNEINAIENEYAIRLSTANSTTVSRNWMVGKLVLKSNGPLHIVGNYFDGYDSHTVDYTLHGIELDGTIAGLRIQDNYFYELPGHAIYRLSGQVRLANISGNHFANCDIFKAGLEDIKIVDATNSYGVMVSENTHLRDEWVALSGGVATRSTRLIGDSNRVAAVNIQTAGSDDGSTAPYSMITDNILMWTAGYVAQTQHTNVVMLNNWPSTLLPDTPMTKRVFTSRASSGMSGNALFVDSADNLLKFRQITAEFRTFRFTPLVTPTTTSAGTLILTVASDEIQLLTGSTTHTVALPTTGVVAGRPHTVINKSSGAVTVQASSGATVAVVPAGSSASFNALVNTPTLATDWYFPTSAGINRNVTTLTTTATIGAAAATDYVVFLGVGAVPTLPTAASNTNRYTLKNIDTTAKSIATTSSQTIDGTTLSIPAGSSVDLISDGANWRIV